MINKKGAKKKKLNKNTAKKAEKNNKKDSLKRAVFITPKESTYKKGLIEVNKQEESYDKLFEQKLAEQYREFRNLKEHHMQSKKFFRILMVLITVVLIALLLLSYRV
jgi:hypothetical protein